MSSKVTRSGVASVELVFFLWKTSQKRKVALYLWNLCSFILIFTTQLEDLSISSWLKNLNDWG